MLSMNAGFFLCFATLSKSIENWKVWINLGISRHLPTFIFFILKIHKDKSSKGVGQ